MSEAPRPVATMPASVQPGIPRLAATPQGWRRVRLREILAVVQRPVVMKENANYRLVTVRRSRGGIAERGYLLGRQISVKSQFRIEEGDFLISKRQIVHGACAVVSPEFAGAIVSNEYAVVRCREDIDLAYLRYMSHSIYFQQICFHSSIGVHIEKMIFSVDRWLDAEFNLPPIEKQREIGAGLGAIERKIALLDEQHAAMTAYRAGVSERLFKQEVRFLRDNGTAFRDWTATTLGRSTRWASGGTPAKGDPSYWGGEIPWISASAMHDSVAYEAQHKVSQKAIGNGTRLAPSGSTLLLVRGMMLKRKVPICRAGRDVAFNQDVKCITPSADNDPEFLFYLLKANEGALMALVSATNVGTAKLDTDQIMGLKIWLPEPDEQKRIASALSTLDTKTNAIAAKIGLMRAFRRGLIDRLFP